MVRKILFLAANPTDSGRLRLDQEVREIGESLRRSNKRKQFELIPNFAVRVDDLRRGMLDHAPRIVHFSGHGGIDGIAVEDNQGQTFEIPSAALAGLFELCAGQIECVILNACYSSGQADAIARHIPYVIGMKSSISDDAALEFSTGFYDALGAGKSIEDSFQFGCNAIALRNIPEDQTPTLKRKSLTAAERQRLESSFSPVQDVYLDVSVTNEDTSSWNRGEETVLRNSIGRDEHRIRIEGTMGYLSSFNGGGPINPLNYLSQTRCPFKWDFPILDFKILNNQQSSLFLTELIFHVEESRADQVPLFVIKEDTQQRNAGDLLLVNEGSCDLIDLTISFHLLPGKIVNPTDFEPPFKHSIVLPLIKDHAEVDITQAFRDEGVDVDDLILLHNGKWDHDTYVAPAADGSEERMTEAEATERDKKCLGRFQDEVGTLVGTISFRTPEGAGVVHHVKFQAPVYLSNRNRMGIPRPSTFQYDTAFETQNANYQRRVQIAQTIQPGDTDRFTVKVAVAQSSFHCFRASIRDITGLELQSLPIELNCFVPRSRQGVVESLIAKSKAE
jgi:hypothetical protein